jgi:hypothetical protein
MMWKIFEELEEPFLRILAKEALLVLVTNAMTHTAQLGYDVLSKKFNPEKLKDDEVLEEEVSEDDAAKLELFREWHNTDGSIPVHEYLEMEWSEYSEWIAKWL